MSISFFLLAEVLWVELFRVGVMRWIFVYPTYRVRDQVILLQVDVSPGNDVVLCAVSCVEPYRAVEP